MGLFSCELFPPPSAEAQARLLTTCQTLATTLQPDYFSVTYGAGGSTREGTVHTIAQLHAAGLKAVPHLSCIGSHREDLLQLLDEYRRMGLRQLVALRGDLPSGMATVSGELRHADELVALIRQHSGDWFHIQVAAYPEMHPEAISPAADMEHFKRKVEAGANGAITQFFYNADAYFAFVDRARHANITIPIVPGIMPIANFARIVRFAEFCKAEIPRWMRLQFEAYRDDAVSTRAFGVEVVVNICRRLLESGVPSLHFYTLNQASLTTEICNNLPASFRYSPP